MRTAENSRFQLPSAVAKFAGRVTIDGKPPKKNCRLFVILNDPNHLEKNANGEEQSLFSVCDSNGNFAFSTYGLRDGVIAGQYVVTFVELHPSPSKRTSVFFLPTSSRGPPPDRYRQPDELKNLYNDPDKNAKNPDFNLDLQPPGYAHYQFDLAVAGKKPVMEPGPNAVTGLPPRSVSHPNTHKRPAPIQLRDDVRCESNRRGHAPRCVLRGSRSGYGRLPVRLAFAIA